MRRLVAAALLAIAGVAVAGCVPHPVGPARTFDSYEGKAATTAESALSAVETVRLAADTSSRGNAFGPYLSVLVSDAEASLDGLAGTFDSIQPPDEQADALHDELAELLQSAGDNVRTVRVSVRRGELDSLADVAEPLSGDADELRAFAEAHG